MCAYHALLDSLLDLVDLALGKTLDLEESLDHSMMHRLDRVVVAELQLGDIGHVDAC